MLACPVVLANPVPADEESLINGADLYEQYCAECHGWDIDATGSGLYATDEDDGLYDFNELVEVPAELESEDSVDDWPEWAEMPDPGNKANPASVRAEIMAELTAAIDDAYGDDELVVDPGGIDSGEIPGEPDAWEPDEEAPVNDEDADVDPGDIDPGDVGRYPGAIDLADPEAYLLGTFDEDIYNSIAEGSGPTMPGFVQELGEEGVWDLVNYITSLWDEELEF